MAGISAQCKDLSISVMVVSILGKKDTPAYELARQSVLDMGHAINEGRHFITDLAIAPLLTEKLSESEIFEPVHGTLIFHPSPLPYGRGASAIRWAYQRGEPITAATWFWANAGKIDSGDICEMEIVKITHDVRPREFYEKHILPAMVRTLERALAGVAAGHPRRVPQVEEYATFDLKI